MDSNGHHAEATPGASSPGHKFGTLAVHAGSPIDPVTGAVIEPVSTFIRVYSISG